VCEEHEKEPRGHTKIWEFVQEQEDEGVIVTKISEAGFRGKTTLMGLPGIPAAILEREVTRLLEAGE
jgi:hypothetical protein